MTNYQNGKIYKIESLIGDCVYYGSTVQKYLSDRLSGHRYGMKNNKQCSSSKVLQYEDAQIYLVELYPCNSKNELHMREGYYIKHNECVNKMVAGRTSKQYKLDNSDYIKKQNKIYYDNNKEKNKQYRKQYNIDNKEKNKQYNKQYRIDNIKKIKNHKNKQYICDCGNTYTCSNYNRHCNTNYHKQYIINPLNRLKL